MQLRSELAATILGVVALNLLLVFSVISLFARMGPAIERILVRNDASIASGEQVLAEFARSSGEALDEAARARVDAALRRAADNITEPGESPILAAIAAHLDGALAGAQPSREALVSALEQLIAINRAATAAADREAQHLGRAGAWVAAFVALASLGLSLFLTRSLGNRVVRPVQDLRDVLHAVRNGDPFRRCTLRRSAPELREVLEGVNRLLDERVTDDGPDRAPPPRSTIG